MRPHLKAHSVIEDSSVRDSDVGPLAHLRPQSVLENTHVGNFVEVKKSRLRGVKAGHLSYLGDADIDEGTNIGAGTITCNYDGMKKYRTIIGKKVFVGSDTQLVAPVETHTDNNVMIAAGTTVTAGNESGISQPYPGPQSAGFFAKFFGKGKNADPSTLLAGKKILLGDRPDRGVQPGAAASRKQPTSAPS